MRHSVKIKLIICGGFAVLLLLVIRLTALREDSKLLDFISKESNRPLVEFSVEQNADTVSIVLSRASRFTCRGYEQRGDHSCCRFL